MLPDATLGRAMTTSLRRHAPVGPRALLARLLDEPALPAQIAALPPRTLGALIRGVGLEDAGELVALATTEQLVAVFDEDLWRADRPGEDEAFDAARFATWLEVLLEAGDAVVARQLAALPEDLVTMALHQHVLVLDMDALADEIQATDDEDEVERVEKALESGLSEELDRYRLVARRTDGWDAVLAAVLALDRDHHALLVRILDRLVAIGGEEIEAHGLHAVLTADEMLASDAAAERDDRRAAIGHVAPRDAAAFLKLALDPAAPPERDAITRAYFRALTRTVAPAVPDAGALRDLLARVERDDDDGGDRRRQLAATTGELAITAALRVLAAADPVRASERQAELAYLANVLVAGATTGAGRDRRPVRPVEAARAALAIVDRGLALAAAGSGAAPAAIVAARTADELFRLGWARLHRDARQKHAANDLDVLGAAPA